MSRWQAVARTFAALAVTATLVSGARADDMQTPGWQKLVYEYKAFWASARSTLELSRCAEQDGWCMEVRSSLANNYEEVSMAATPAGTLRNRWRLSSGKNQRLKEWDYGRSSILRERREPGPQDAANPADWPVTSQRELAYPGENHAITDASLLLALAAPTMEGSVSDSLFIVHTDLNFYQVGAAAAGNERVSVNYRTSEGDAAEASTRPVTLVNLKVTPLEPLQDKPDFSLLGLSQPLTIAYDSETGVPVQVRGKAPRLGAVELNLTAVVFRDSQP